MPGGCPCGRDGARSLPYSPLESWSRMSLPDLLWIKLSSRFRGGNSARKYSVMVPESSAKAGFGADRPP